MVSVDTQKKMVVRGVGTDWPNIFVPVLQLEGIKKLFEAEGIPYYVEARSISINDGPAVTVLHFERSQDAGRAQTLLDAVP